MKTNTRHFIITTSTIFLITACSWNPFSREQPTPAPTPTTNQVSQAELESIRQELEQKTGVIIPTAQPTTATNPQITPNTATNAPNSNISVPRQEIALRGQSGGDATGYINREYQNSQFSLNVLADLPTPQSNEFYNVWIARGQVGDENYSLKSLGKIDSAKGGYIFEYQTSENYSDYQHIIISKESQADETIEQTILTGNFPS